MGIFDFFKGKSSDGGFTKKKHTTQIENETGGFLPLATQEIYLDVTSEFRKYFQDEERNGYKLVRIENGSPVREWILMGRHITVGRSIENDVTVDDPLVSEKHCIIHLEPHKRPILEDSGSTNGTYYNNRKFKLRKEKLKEGDFFRLGTTDIQIVKDDGSWDLSKKG